MPELSLVFHIHAARPLLRRRIQDAGTARPLFDEEAARSNIHRLARVCFDPAFDMLAELAPAGLPIGLAVSGPTIEQLVRHAPRTLERLQRLAMDGNVELVGQTYQQSLAELGDVEEFIVQVEQHRRAVSHYFTRDTGPVFRGTGLHLSPSQLPLLRRLGFTAALVRVADGGALRSNTRSGSKVDPRFMLLPRNNRLSDDLASRFSDRSWDRWPLTSDRFAEWIAASPGSTINLDLDIRILGDANPADSGVFDFVRHLPVELARRGVRVVAPAAGLPSHSSADRARPAIVTLLEDEAIRGMRLDDHLRRGAMRRLYALRPHVQEPGGNASVEWSRLTCADYLRPLAPDAQDRSPFRSRFDAFMSFMHSLDEIETAACTRRRARASMDVVGRARTPDEREARPQRGPDPMEGSRHSATRAGNRSSASRH